MKCTVFGQSSKVENKISTAQIFKIWFIHWYEKKRTTYNTWLIIPVKNLLFRSLWAVGLGIGLVLRRLPKYFTRFALSGTTVICDGVIDFCDCCSASSGLVSLHIHLV